MTNSEFIAGLIGPLLMTIGFALAIDKNTYRRLVEEIEANSAVVFLAGAILLVASLAVVRVHNVWEGWPVIVTIFGWLGVVGGIARILFAQNAAEMAKPFTDRPALVAVAAALMVVLGGYLSLKGYRII